MNPIHRNALAAAGFDVTVRNLSDRPIPDATVRS